METTSNASFHPHPLPCLGTTSIYSRLHLDVKEATKTSQTWKKQNTVHHLLDIHVIYPFILHCTRLVATKNAQREWDAEQGWMRARPREEASAAEGCADWTLIGCFAFAVDSGLKGDKIKGHIKWQGCARGFLIVSCAGRPPGTARGQVHVQSISRCRWDPESMIFISLFETQGQCSFAEVWDLVQGVHTFCIKVGHSCQN